MKLSTSTMANDELLGRIARARIDRVHVVLRQDGDGWVRSADLLGDGGELLECLGRIRRWASTDADGVAAALFLDSYVWCLSGAAAAAILLEARVPDLRQESVRMRFGDDGRAATITFEGSQLLVARSEVLPDPELVAGYRAMLVDHLEPLVDCLHRRVRRAQAAFWRAAGDMAAYTLAWCGRALDDEVRGYELGRELLDGSSPLGYPRAFRVVERAGAQKLICVRHGCCLWLRTAHGATCEGCPVRRERDGVPALVSNEWPTA